MENIEHLGLTIKWGGGGGERLVLRQQTLYQDICKCLAPALGYIRMSFIAEGHHTYTDSCYYSSLVVAESYISHICLPEIIQSLNITSMGIFSGLGRLPINTLQTFPVSFIRTFSSLDSIFSISLNIVFLHFS